jgi:choline dehydrogenase-like flavoprotein
MVVRLLPEVDAYAVDENSLVCVVGAGIAGLILAHRLAHAGYRVIILESGVQAFDPSIHELNNVELPRRGYRGALNGRFRGLGGTSTQWGGRMLPLTYHDIGPRRYVELDEWPITFAEIDKYRCEIETMFGLDHTSFEEDVLDRLYPDKFLEGRDPDIVQRYPKWATFKRCNVAYLLRHDIERNPRLEIWLGATVCAFELDEASGRLKAVKAQDFAGRNITIRAQEYVFAAGTIETTRLLLLLDAVSKGRAFERCRALGRYFQDHLTADLGKLRVLDARSTNRWFGYHFIGSTRRNLHLELSPARQTSDAVASTSVQIFLDIPERSALSVLKDYLRGLQKGEFNLTFPDVARIVMDSPSAVRMGYWRFVQNQLYLPPEVGLILNVQVEQLPNYQNRISLSSIKDRLGVPLARIDWDATAADERAMRTCIAHIGAYWRRTRLDKICPIEWSGNRDKTSMLTDLASDLNHPSGSTRMGILATESVVAPDLRCHHVGNISVVSASVFPSAGSANPTYTIISLAMRAADRLALALG